MAESRRSHPTEPRSAEQVESRRVLIVETKAHAQKGHFPLIFAERAAGLLDLGCEIEVLTSSGWTLEGDPELPSLTIRRYGRFASFARRFALRLRWVPPRRLGKFLVSVGMEMVIVFAARWHARKAHSARVLLMDLVDPRVVSMFAGAGRWVLYQWGPPRMARSILGAAAKRLAQRVERRRERRGGWLRVAVSTEELLALWRAEVPWLASSVVPYAAVRERPSLSPAVARGELGLPQDARLALLFGSHPAKDDAVVFRAFSQLPGWRLVIAGNGAGDSFREWAADHDGVHAPTPIVFDGYVDEHVRASLHTGADLLVLSFRSWSIGQDSGGVVDAIAWGIPVACSDRCPAATLTRKYGLGTVFEPGDEDALIAAVRSAPAAPEPAGLAKVRSELSADHVAHLLIEELHL